MRPALFKSGQWNFHQDHAPVHKSILVTDYLTNMGIKRIPQPPYSPNLVPCDFCLFPELRGCRYETIEVMKEAMTKVLNTLTQKDFHEVVGKVEQVHCNRRRLLRRGLKFHVCTINKYEKSLETYLMILAYNQRMLIRKNKLKYILFKMLVWDQISILETSIYLNNSIDNHKPRYIFSLLPND